VAETRPLTPEQIEFVITMAGRSIAIVFLAVIVILFFLARRRNPSDIAIGGVFTIWFTIIVWSYGHSLVTGGGVFRLPYWLWFLMSAVEIVAVVVLIRERLAMEQARGELAALARAHERGEAIVQRVEQAAQRAEDAAEEVKQAAEAVKNGH
jgi:hypothetical protein